jgi:hypothetical protein
MYVIIFVKLRHSAECRPESLTTVEAKVASIYTPHTKTFLHNIDCICVCVCMCVCVCARACVCVCVCVSVQTK